MSTEVAIERTPTTRNNLAAVVVLCVAGLTYATLEGMVAPALPILQQAVGASPAAIAWVFTGLLLTGTVSVPLVGRLSDVYGPKRVLLGVLVITSLGVVCAALADSIVLLALGQSLQGVGVGFVPLSITALSRLRAGSGKGGVGLVIAMAGLGTIAGGLLAGPLLAALSYRFIYWIPLGVLVLTGLAMVLVLPDARPESRQRIDWAGAALLAGGLVSLLLGVTMIGVAGDEVRADGRAERDGPVPGRRVEQVRVLPVRGEGVEVGRRGTGGELVERHRDTSRTVEGRCGLRGDRCQSRPPRFASRVCSCT
ncbi:MFS transporter [Lentzea sp. HUAS12]|uniref:MFS transporter n=1 Tax=Lentzea sp. HUAS12 TaxID=2951806 RepID=UPI00209D3C21|nr:MFS transporter [Lentzea sp. HUAS12]USX52822.1 MFS transporter [Lentzea sp. HUAS12]